MKKTETQPMLINVVKFYFPTDKFLLRFSTYFICKTNNEAITISLMDFKEEKKKTSKDKEYKKFSLKLRALFMVFSYIQTAACRS